MMLGRDGVAGLICLAVSLALLGLTLNLPPAAEVPVGPAFYPRVTLFFLGGLSVVLIALDILAHRRLPAGAAEAAAGPPRNYTLVLITFVQFGLYILLLPGLGFRLATILFVAALQVALEWPRSPRQWALVAAVAVGTSLVCYAVFEDYLSVLLPRGTWSGM